MSEWFLFVGEVAKRSNALGSGPSPSGSRVRFSPSSLCLRYGVVGNMSGFHPVASGSIPGSGWLLANRGPFSSVGRARDF